MDTFSSSVCSKTFHFRLLTIILKREIKTNWKAYVVQKILKIYKK